MSDFGVPERIVTSFVPNPANNSINMINEVHIDGQRYGGKFEISLREASRRDIFDIIERRVAETVRRAFEIAFKNNFRPSVMPKTGQIDFSVGADAKKALEDLNRMQRNLDEQARYEAEINAEFVMRKETERLANEARKRSPVASSRRGGKTLGRIVDLVRAFKEARIRIDEFQEACAQFGLTVPDAVRAYAKETGEDLVTGRSKSAKAVEKRGRIEEANRTQNSQFKKKPEPRKIEDVIRDGNKARASNIELDYGNIYVDEENEEL